MKPKFIIIFLYCLFTILTQILHHYTPLADSLRYLQLAREYSQFNFFDPATNFVGHPVYPLFLAIIGNLISYHPYVTGFIQSLIFCLSALFLIRELEIYMQKKLSGLFIILLLVPEILFFNGFVLTESLTFSLIILVFGFALRIYNGKATLSNLFILSFFIGITVINRFEWIICIPSILYLIFPRIKDRLSIDVLIIVSIPLFMVLLNGVKNYKTYDVYKITSFNGGEGIYAGNNLNLDGSHHSFTEYKEIFIPKNKIDDLNKILLQPDCLSHPKRDSFYLSLAIDAWKENPLQQLSVIPQKLAKNWLLPGNFDVYTSDTTKTRGLQLTKILSKKYFNNERLAPYKHLFFISIHWILLLIIILGLFGIDRQNRFQISILILFLLNILLSIPFCGLPRWHVPILPVLIIAFTPFSIVTRINNFIHFNVFQKFMKK